jgi:type IV pilus assembly protein PilB
VSKLKTLSNLDPSVCEIPQLGKLCFKVENTILIASVSSFPTIMGERISLKIYKPPSILEKIIPDEKQRNTLLSAVEKPGIILVCGSPLSGKTHVIYSLLMETTEIKKNIMTIESIAKYDLSHINQCELNENIGFNMDKALRFVEFQSPDVLYLEGIKTREAFEFLSELYYNDTTVITEFMANNMTDLRQKLAFDDFQVFKTLISCLVFIHSRESIEVFDKSTLQKYLA